MTEPQFKIELVPGDIRIAGFSIQRNVGRDILTSKIPDMDGEIGLYVAPKLTMSNVADGYLFYSQICTHHLLRVRNGGREKQFATEGRIYGDCPSPGNSYLRKYFVKDNEVLDLNGMKPTRPWVIDTPWIFLSDNIEFMHCDITLETWLQFGTHDGPKWPIFKFCWKLHADIAKTANGWDFGWRSFSSPDEIVSSIHRFRPGASPLNVRDYEGLKQAVGKFWSDFDAGL